MRIQIRFRIRIPNNASQVKKCLRDECSPVRSYVLPGGGNLQAINIQWVEIHTNNLSKQSGDWKDGCVQMLIKQRYEKVNFSSAKLDPFFKTMTTA
jgi:hypothetical protein